MRAPHPNVVASRWEREAWATLRDSEMPRSLRYASWDWAWLPVEGEWHPGTPALVEQRVAAALSAFQLGGERALEEFLGLFELYSKTTSCESSAP